MSILSFIKRIMTHSQISQYVSLFSFLVARWLFHVEGFLYAFLLKSKSFARRMQIVVNTSMPVEHTAEVTNLFKGKSYFKVIN